MALIHLEVSLWLMLAYHVSTKLYALSNSPRDDGDGCGGKTEVEQVLHVFTASQHWPLGHEKASKPTEMEKIRLDMSLADLLLSLLKSEGRLFAVNAKHAHQNGVDGSPKASP